MVSGMQAFLCQFWTELGGLGHLQSWGVFVHDLKLDCGIDVDSKSGGPHGHSWL